MQLWSPSSRRAWIEIPRPQPYRSPRLVALLAEGVDRNMSSIALPKMEIVALLAEGVDRNATENDAKWEGYRSPSSRRAWIEMRW